MSKKFLLIDLNSLGHAAHRSHRLTAAGIQTQSIYGCLRTARQLRNIYPEHEQLWLNDGKAQWRYDIHPDYKSNRDNDEKKRAEREQYKRAKPFILRGLGLLGLRVMTALTHEADDMAGYWVATLTRKHPDCEIVLITGDQDWIQLVRKNVTWRDLRDDTRQVSLDNLFEYTGYRTPYRFLEGKCLAGDNSDVISGVGGIGEKGAPEFIAEFGSVREFWRQCDSGEFKPKKKIHQNLHTGPGRALFARNLRLMQLLKPPVPAKDQIKVEPHTFDIEGFKAYCQELSFMSILRDITTFTKPFKK